MDAGEETSEITLPVSYGPQASAPHGEATHRPEQPFADTVLAPFVAITQVRQRSALAGDSLTTPLTVMSAAARTATTAARSKGTRLRPRRHSGRLIGAWARTGKRGMCAYAEALIQRQPERDRLRILIEDAEAEHSLVGGHCARFHRPRGMNKIN